MQSKELWDKVKKSVKEKIGEYKPKSAKSEQGIKDEKSYIHGTSAGEMPNPGTTRSTMSATEADEAFKQ